MGSNRKSKEVEKKKLKRTSPFPRDEGKSEGPKTGDSEKKEKSSKKHKSHKSSKCHSNKEKKSGEKHKDKDRKHRDHSKSGEKHKDKDRKHRDHSELNFHELSNEDYFSMNNKFATWLKEERKLYFSDLSSDSARDLFKEFVVEWNNKELEPWYYDGIAIAPRTSHNWNIKK